MYVAWKEKRNHSKTTCSLRAHTDFHFFYIQIHPLIPLAPTLAVAARHERWRLLRKFDCHLRRRVPTSVWRRCLSSARCNHVEKREQARWQRKTCTNRDAFGATIPVFDDADGGHACAYEHERRQRQDDRQYRAKRQRYPGYIYIAKKRRIASREIENRMTNE